MVTSTKKNIKVRFKNVLAPLLKDGIGDTMDKGNLYIVPGFVMLLSAALWASKLAELSLGEAVCRGASVYDMSGTTLDEDAQRHCQTAKRYFIGRKETLQYDHSWREQRHVENPDWILWVWCPIFFFMFVIPKFFWSILMENKGINFKNVLNASTNVVTKRDGISEVDRNKLFEKLSVIEDNFQCATSSLGLVRFLVFEMILVLTPAVLLMIVLPVFLGRNYSTFGADVLKAFLEKKEWQGTPLSPVFGSSNNIHMKPLFPRITYCDYPFVTLGNATLTYRCYLDSNWHERTALFIWYMLSFLTFINMLNFIIWLIWAVLMHNKTQRRQWVKRNWLRDEKSVESESIESFAATFKTGNVLLFYYIEAHTDCVVARAIAKALFENYKTRLAENGKTTHRSL